MWVVPSPKTWDQKLADYFGCFYDDIKREYVFGTKRADKWKRFKTANVSYILLKLGYFDPLTSEI